MGNINSINKVNFEYIQTNINQFTLINTLDHNMQHCLIYNTLHADKEEYTINQMLYKNKRQNEIIIYGKNYFDEKCYKKYNQLKQLGFKNIKIYPGGLFEWLCLQEIYGNELFKTNGNETDILKYK
jgi:hypothetical protein